MERSKEITDGLRQLCGLMLGDDLPPDELRLRLSHSVQLVTNPVFSSCQWDESKLVESINKRLAKAGKSTSALQFSRLCGKLREKDMLNNRAGVLKFLLSLNQHGRRKETDATLFRSGGSQNSVAAAASNDPDPDSSVTKLGQQKRQFALDGLAVSSSCDYQTSSWKRAHAVAPFVMEDCQRVESGSTSIGQTRRNPLAARQAFDPDALRTPDSSLLRDVVFALQGIDGQYFRYDSKNDAFNLLSSAKISSPKRDLLLRISEMGWLHGRVKTYCESKTGGLIAQAFRSALQDELSEFYKQLAVSHSQIAVTSSAIDQGISSPTTEHGGQSAGPLVTARRLHVMLSGWKQKLIALASFVEQCQGSHGGALLSRLYENVQHGDPDWRRLALELLNVSCRPLFAFIVKWIREGALDDRANEFFVGCNETVDDEAGVWQSKYVLIEDMLPSFVSESLARTILLTGKSLNCIRYILKDPDAIETVSTDCLQFTDTEGAFLADAQLPAQFSALVQQAHDRASERLTQLMDSRFLLSAHLAAMKKYLLLSRGDFAWHLMDVLESELDKPLEKVRLHNLSSCLDLVIRQTNAQFEPAAILDCLHVEVIESPTDERDGDQKTGWDIFALKYRVDGPLRIVIGEDCCISYSLLFHFVWRLKRLSFSLTTLWHRLMSTSKILKMQAPNAPSLLQPFQLAAGEASRFVECMQYYFLFQVLECGWHKFRENLCSKDLDVIAASHENYLNELLRKSFQMDQYSLLSQRFYAVLDAVSQFQSFCCCFLDSLDSKRASRADLAKLNKEQREWFVLKPFDTTSRSRLRDLILQYRVTLKSFVTSLLDQSDDELRALGLRLDFSGFYSEEKP